MKCRDCKVRGGCLGETVPRLCELAATDPAYARQLRVIAGEAEPLWPYLRKSWRDRINTCPYRECRTGCEWSLCHAGRGDQWGQVTLADCYHCLGGTTV